jgi:lysophospholipid acyltransferase (LPLAT)-like uncharacterized protein
VKALFRSPPVQAVLAFLLAGYLRLCLSTIRWRSENREAAEAVWDAGGPVIVCFWHARISLAPACWDLKRGQPPRALISLSPDGEFIARAVSRLGFPAIRGSSAKKSAPDKAKGGAAAFRDVLTWLKGGGGIAITPDGPRGPAEQMAEGAVMLAKLSKAPVLLVGLACRPAGRLGTWDRAVLPTPFGRGAIVWDGPIHWEAQDDTETLRRDWAERLTRATERAESLLLLTGEGSAPRTGAERRSAREDEGTDLHDRSDDARVEHPSTGEPLTLPRGPARSASAPVRGAHPSPVGRGSASPP